MKIQCFLMILKHLSSICHSYQEPKGPYVTMLKHFRFLKTPFTFWEVDCHSEVEL